MSKKQTSLTAFFSVQSPKSQTTSITGTKRKREEEEEIKTNTTTTTTIVNTEENQIIVEEKEENKVVVTTTLVPISLKPKQLTLRRKLDFTDYDQEGIEFSKFLIGKYIIRMIKEGEKTIRMVGKIVEVEAYLGAPDKGAHSYKGVKNTKNSSMFEKPGTSYVYTIYKYNQCFNISCRGDGVATLIRALEPIEGLERMTKNRSAPRGKKESKSTKPMKPGQLCSGPGKLCSAMNIDMSHNGIDLCDSSQDLWVEDWGTEIKQITQSPRINIDYAQEWASKPLRFTLSGSKYISVPIKKALP